VNIFLWRSTKSSRPIRVPQFENRCSASSGIGGGGASAPAKFWFVKNSSKITKNLGKMGPNFVWFCTQHFQKNPWRHFLEVLPKKGLHDLWPL